MPAQKGFTLVELMVVITIIAILSVVGVVVYTNVTKSARMASRRADIEAISKAYETNFDGSKYPTLTKDNFAGALIPTPYSGGSYFMYGPNITGAKTDGFALCASLVDDNTCSMSSSDCFCLSSSQGSANIDLLSQAPNVIFADSLETDLDSNGVADGWIKTWVGGPPPTGSNAGYRLVSPGFYGSFAQKVENTQFGEGFYSFQGAQGEPNSRYTYSAYVRLLSKTSGMSGVNIRIAVNSGGGGVFGSSALTTISSTFTKLSVDFTTNSSPSQGFLFTVVPMEAGSGERASYEVDAVQIVKQ